MSIKTRLSLAFMFIAGVLVLTTIPQGLAETKKEKKVELNVNFGITDNLKSIQATKEVVELHLRNGQAYQGKIGAVGSAYVLITELSGKEFYDALVTISDISAVEVRAR